MLVIFMACLLLALGDKFPSKGGTTRNLGVRHRLPIADDRPDNTNRKRLHSLIGNEEDKSYPSSTIQHIRDLLGLASKSENPQWLVKVKDKRNMKNVNEISGAKKAKRSATQPHEDAKYQPVHNLKAVVVNSSSTRIVLSWEKPVDVIDPSVIKHYVLIVDSKGVNCGDDLNTARYLTSNTYLDLDLLCGNTYTLSVRAVTNNGSSADKETFISIPSQIGAVRNLAVKFIPGNNATRNNATDLIKQRVDGFWLTWEPPANVKPVDVKEYDVLVSRDSLVVFHNKTVDTQVFVRSPDPVFGLEYTFGIACQTVCGYGERINLTIYYPDLPSPPTPLLPTVFNPTSITPISPVSTLPTVASAVATYSTPATYSTVAKSFSSSPQQSQQTDEPFPYWSIPMAGFGIILAVIVMYFVRKHRRRKKFKRTLAMHPSYPQDYAENASEFEEDELLVMLANVSDDETLITA